MKHKVMFGPAGSPVNYKGAAYKAPKYIKEEGLDSYEYQSPYGVRIGEKSAKILKEASIEVISEKDLGGNINGYIWFF